MNKRHFRAASQIIIILGLVVICRNLTVCQSTQVVKPSISTGEKTQDWKEFSSAVGGFRILFPKSPTQYVRTIHVGKMIVTSYTFTVRDDNTYSVMYFDVPAANDPAVKDELLVALRNSALADFKAHLLTDNPVSINQTDGRLLEVSVSNRRLARVIILVADARAYQVAMVPEKPVRHEENAKSLSTGFFDSFRLLAIDRSNEGEVDTYLRSDKELAQRAFAGEIKILNSNALSLPAPKYPPSAHGASGTVTVKVIIDEHRTVMAAQAVSGHQLLRSAAEDAAREARFKPKSEQGKAVRILGYLFYNFVNF